ncbi:hypothetical protein BN946_scf185015.g130 [Trametes cinnabarina]|uniref:non-specific serine/threonine protein kinase n=1 Tax=Pycnoporus cinnabarinus TaxID=5643 RepID=A0A060SI24_PYCCI|nr:hypothetical protein BN946_scf185015.g130 [Trametes cinnabarina]
MDEDDPLTDSEFITRSLAEVDDRFEHQSEINFVAVYLKIAFRVLESDDPRNISAAVRAAVYNSLGRSLLHHTAALDERMFEDLTGFIARGMRDPERLVRLAAGHVLAGLVKTVQRLEERPSPFFSAVFQKIYPLLRYSDQRVRETTIIIVGLIGKTAPGAILRDSICALITQLCEPNPILKGTAVLQLHALCKHHHKSPYSLTAAYMNRIAPYLVKRFKTHPDGVPEICRFLSVSQRDFINLTLKYTLPQLFADGDLKGLEAVGAEMGSSVAMLVLDYAQNILAHAYMLQGFGQTNKTIKFILDVLKAAASDGSSLQIITLINSCIILLLAEIVICLGDEDPDIVDAASQGLRKVAREATSPKSNLPIGSDEEYNAFLKEHMLGIISTLNDMLQEVHGKQSMESKQRILRSFGEFAKQVGPAISNVAPQVMATLQTMLVVPEFSDAALQSWHSFLATLDPTDIGPHVGPTSASFVASWSLFSARGREAAKQCLDYMVLHRGQELGPHLSEVADLSSIPELAETNEALAHLRAAWSPQQRLRALMDRLESESLAVAIQSAVELKAFLTEANEDYIRSLTFGDAFDPLVGFLVSAVYRAACRDGEGTDTLRDLAFDCIGIVGAIDPDRFELRVDDNRMIMLSNFTDESESMSFALHLIQDVLVGAFRSTSDIKYQSYLAYAIQQLLQFCKFTPDLIKPHGSHPPNLKVRKRWNSLPKHVLETVSPLLESRFSLETRPLPPLSYPIYPGQSTYRQWVQAWTSDLIQKVSEPRAMQIFQVFTAVVRNKDVGVAHHLLPHLVLNVLASGDSDNAGAIRTEILAVLEDQVNPDSQSSPDKKLLSAQTVFMLLDHLNKWIRAIRQEIARQQKAAGSSRRTSRNSQVSSDAIEQLTRIASILENIDQGLMANAAFQCKAYARSLMNLEQQLMDCQIRDSKAKLEAKARRDTETIRRIEAADYQDRYERLHELYAHLDEPDGMEGVSTMILSPSLEHQIRQHESTGTWTSAQSCWELRLQYEPDSLEHHLGLLRCLKNLGHYDSLRTHVLGVLTKHPEWSPHLIGYQVESEWMVGRWDDVQALVSKTEDRPPAVLLAQILLAMRQDDIAALKTALVEARRELGSSIVATGPTGYRRSYDAVLNLHLVHELEVINQVVKGLRGEPARGSQSRDQSFNTLLKRLSARFDSTLPSFRIREPILNMRRTAFNLSASNSEEVKDATGKLWLSSAKIARKAGHLQTAYSAILQAERCKTPYSFVESAKLIRARGDPLRALQELEKAMRLCGFLPKEGNSREADVIDLTVGADVKEKIAKVNVLRARYMDHTDRFEDSKVCKEFRKATDISPKWESGQFHLGQFQDDCFKALPAADKRTRGLKMNFQTVRAFTRAMKYGSKYTYQTVPRVLTIWLDLAEDSRACATELFQKINDEVSRAIRSTPVYKWYTAFPQIVSRIGIKNAAAYETLSALLLKVIKEYPKQALWLFSSVAKSTSSQRAQRSKKILDKLRSVARNDGSQLMAIMTTFTADLLSLSKLDASDKQPLSLLSVCPKLPRMMPSPIIIPLQESLTANIPPASASDAHHNPFPVNAPTFVAIHDEIEVMSSMARPKKLVIHGSDGQIYTFLGKKDDLRKDSRLMDFNAILNKLLKSDSDSRRRQLHIRTYGVVSLNEEAGLIQWVPNTAPIRPILLKLYDRHGIANWLPHFKALFDDIKNMTDHEKAAELFSTKILTHFPPVLHEWFIETFPEPTVWLASRTAYSRTAAVMSMVGYILGLGDRHCENILLDTMCGDVVHVDFDCLFEKGQALEIPEIVPFRLTQNIVAGFGVTGVEGVFRIACEVTLRLLRENKDCLMNVLDAFVHDPLVEWEEKFRRLTRANPLVDMRTVSQDALGPIEEKLRGVFKLHKSSSGRQLSVSNHVQSLIMQASDVTNLARMYVGWAPYH